MTPPTPIYNDPNPPSTIQYVAWQIDQLRSDVRAAGLDELDGALEKAYLIAKKEIENGI